MIRPLRRAATVYFKAHGWELRDDDQVYIEGVAAAKYLGPQMHNASIEFKINPYIHLSLLTVKIQILAAGSVPPTNTKFKFTKTPENPPK